MAYDQSTGEERWRREPWPAQEVPAHPTAYAGLVFYTFEDGPNSSVLVALNGSTGAVAFETTDLAFSLIWPVPAAGVVAYMSYLPDTSDVGVVARWPNGSVLWYLDALPTTGLNNNPNLDVDAADVLMYLKPQEERRFLALLDAHTGAQKAIWETDGPVADYDTLVSYIS